MARIRSIKPEFPHSESMGLVSRDARLCFLMLWTLADDAGRLRGHSRALASLLFPYDDDAPAIIDDWMDELEREGCIVRYISGDAHYVAVCNWLKHQKIDKPTPSRLPEPPRILASPRESSRILPVGSGSGSGSKDLDLDREWESSRKVATTAHTREPELGRDPVTGYVAGAARMRPSMRPGLVSGAPPSAVFACAAFSVPAFLHAEFRGKLATAGVADPETDLMGWYGRLRDQQQGQETPADNLRWLRQQFDVWRQPPAVRRAPAEDDSAARLAAWAAQGAAS